MATVSQWTPFGVALDLTATAGTVTRTSATQFTVVINASWETYWSGGKTNYGMKVTSGGKTIYIPKFDGDTYKGSGSGSLTGTYSISGNGAQTKTVSVVFENYKTSPESSAKKTITLSVKVPAWTSYTVSYNANGGSGAPSSQTKWKDQTLTLSSTKPTRTGYSFQGWATSASGSVAYAAGAKYTANAGATLYAVWKANTYTVSYNANGGSGAPANQTKTYGVTLTLSSTKPTRTNYSFKGWATSASATTVQYVSGGSYTSNAAITLYAVWELSYKKPTISSLTAARCDSSGTLSDSGTYALLTVKWSTYKTVTSISVTWVDATGESSGSATISASGTSGTVKQVIGDGTFDTEISYSFTVTVADGSSSANSTDRTTTMSGMEFHMDFGENAVAVGKPAETLVNQNGDVVKAFDVEWLLKSRNHLCVGDKIGYHDGKYGIFLSNEGYIHLQRSTAQGYNPYIGFYLDDATAANGQIRLNSSTKIMEFLSAEGYKFGDDVELAGRLDFANNKPVYALDPNGLRKNVLEPQSQNGNTTVGYGNYANKSGNTNIYGHDVLYYVSNIASPGSYRPYRRQGDSVTVSIRTAGYVTNSGKDVSFWVPFSMPIIGSPTVTVASGNGFTLRQGGKYTHGSSASESVTPDSYTTGTYYANGIYITAVFSDTTNVTNNDSIGIYWNGTITFS